MRLFAFTFGGVGLILVAIAAFLFFKEQSFLSTAEEATGKVTKFDVITDSDGESVCPLIEFTTKRGQLVRFEGDVCSSPPNFKIGDPENVIYDPQNPGNVQTKGFVSEYLASIILSGIGLIFWCIGLWFFFKSGYKP